MPRPDPDPEPPHLPDGNLVRRPVGACVVIELSGELDLSRAAHLRERLAGASVHDDVIVDVSEVPFVDSVALGVLARAALLHREQDRHLVLCGARPYLRKVLAITRLGSLLPDAGTIDEARALVQTLSHAVPRGNGRPQEPRAPHRSVAGR